ncbi:MAG: 30S ribosomal protein S5 [Armatimonadota bacterium]|nr:30S ribosomal protein S5 [Armatimonadota bacterium]
MDLQMEERQVQYEERVIEIRRVSKTHKGGKRLSFRALVVIGDGKGKVGAAIGKALTVPEAVRKAYERACKDMIEVPLVGDTIPHEVVGKACTTRVLLKPAGAGTGVIASGPVRAVMDVLGVKNVLTKTFGSRNKVNTVWATIMALKQLRSPMEVAEMRGIRVQDLPMPAKVKRRLIEDELAMQQVGSKISETSVEEEPDRVSEGSESDSESTWVDED